MHLTFRLYTKSGYPGVSGLNMLGMDQPVLKGTFTSGIRSTAARAMRLKGAGPKAQEADDDAAAVPVETIEDMREKFFQRRAAHGGIQELRAIPEEVPAGWDPDADWNLRIKSRQWWKERRDPSFLDKLPDATHRLFHAIRVGAVPIVAALLDELGDGAVGGAIDPETGKGWTCLHVAAYRGNLATCRLLLARRGERGFEDLTGLGVQRLDMNRFAKRFDR